MLSTCPSLQKVGASHNEGVAQWQSLRASAWLIVHCRCTVATADSAFRASNSQRARTRTRSTNMSFFVIRCMALMIKIEGWPTVLRNENAQTSPAWLIVVLVALLTRARAWSTNTHQLFPLAHVFLCNQMHGTQDEKMRRMAHCAQQKMPRPAHPVADCNVAFPAARARARAVHKHTPPIPINTCLSL